MKRREFIKQSSSITAGTLLLPFVPFRASGGAESRSPALVFVFLRGGVDLLSFLPPLEDPRYFDFRPGIAVSRKLGSELKLSSPFSLHPKARPLARLWKDKTLSFVLRTGISEALRSHSDAEAFLERGTPRLAEQTGFLYRAVKQLGGRSGIRAIALQETTPRSLMGDEGGILAFGSLSSFELEQSKLVDTAALARLYGNEAGSLLDSSVTSAFRVMKDLAPFRKDRAYAKFAAAFPGHRFGKRLADIGWLIKRRPDVPLFVTQLNGWDTHAQQGVETGTFANLTDQLATGLSALSENLGHDWSRTVVVAVTEFGRTVAENCAKATDHGHGSLALVAGGSVRGGRMLGSWSELKKEELFEERDLNVSTDYRAVLSEVLSEHMKVPDLAAVFPGFKAKERLGIFKA